MVGIVFASDRDGQNYLFQKTSSGSGSEEPILKSDTAKNGTDWSPDGQFIAYETQDPKTGSDLWLLPQFGDRKPVPFLRTEFNEGQGQFSPDGRWMAHTSDESGRREVYVLAFPVPGGKVQISTAGGEFPKWRNDGKEIFYLAPDRRLMAVPVQPDSTLAVGKSRALFETRIFSVGGIPYVPYCVSAGGQRFLVNTTAEESNSSPMTVVLNWTAALKK